jgi:hypothetical protein
MAVGRVYTVVLTGTVTAAGTDAELFYIAPADDKGCRLLAVSIDATSEVAEAQEEWVALVIRRGHTTVGSGGTAPTPQPCNPYDTAAGFTARVNDTTLASAGTGVDLWSGGFNVRAGLREVFTPEQLFTVTQAQGSLVVRMTSTLADDATFNATIWVEEQ